MNEVIKNIVERRSIRKYKRDMIPNELIDEVLKEPNGNAKTDVAKMAETIKKKIVSITKELQNLDVNELIDNRYQKFRNM